MPGHAQGTPSPVSPTDTTSKSRAEATTYLKRPALSSSRHSDPSGSLSLQKPRSSSSLEEEFRSSRRRKSKKRSYQRHENASRSADTGPMGQRLPDSDPSRFRPSLTRISEAGHATSASRLAARGLRDRSYSEGVSKSRDRLWSSSGRVPVSRRVLDADKRSDIRLKATPSLLSVSSNVTGTSGNSSGSGSTITQRSYDQQANKDEKGSQADAGRYRGRRANSSSPQPDAFDYLVDSIEGEQDLQDHTGPQSSSSRDSASDAGSSEAPDTPSSRSTFPSPTTVRSQSSLVHRKLDLQQYAPTESNSADNWSPHSSTRSIHRPPSVTDEEEDHANPDLSSPEDLYGSMKRTSSQSSTTSSRRRYVGQFQHHEDLDRQHEDRAQPSPYSPANLLQRSFSASSGHSTHSAHAYQLAMQHYQWPPPPPPPSIPQLPPISPTHQLPTPDAAQRTITGYEQLALALTNSDSTSPKPLYRKFEYLNHRILLHIQDELSELEEQLRALDDTIAQTDAQIPSPPQDGSAKSPPPASRRREAFHGHELHRRRTHLLGTIFLKTEQYNRAMTAYASMLKDSAVPEAQHVDAYREWMGRHAPVHEVEARFLRHDEDLILPGGGRRTGGDAEAGGGADAMLVYLLGALMLPLLLFALIPTFSGRLVVAALMALGPAGIVANTPRMRRVLSLREWAICGTAYGVFMGGLAGWIP